MPVTTTRRVRLGFSYRRSARPWPDYAAAVRTVESLGFDTLWNFDHLLPWNGDAQDPCFETWTTLTAMATLTSRIRLGTLVNGVLYRDPATLAKSAAMVDIISGGRLEFSLGAPGRNASSRPMAAVPARRRAYGPAGRGAGDREGALEPAAQHLRGRYYRLQDAPFEPARAAPAPADHGGGQRRAHAAPGGEACRQLERQRQSRRVRGTDRALARGVRRARPRPGEIELSMHSSLAVARSREAARERSADAARSQGLAADNPDEQGCWGRPAR